MSLESWKEEFLPISATKLADSNPTELEALQHAELKWTGLLQHNLYKHRVYVGRNPNKLPSIISMDSHKSLGIAAECVLCKINRFCENCPLGDCGVEWDRFTYLGDPTHMLSKIKAAIKKENEK